VEGEKNPKVLFERFRSGIFDQATLSDSLISLIEKSDLFPFSGFDGMSSFNCRDIDIIRNRGDPKNVLISKRLIIKNLLI
jgi:hypothetical protein